MSSGRAESMPPTVRLSRQHRSGPVPRTCVAGFTLIEVLVALLIFAIIAAIGYRTLTVVIETRTRVANENRHWRALAFAIGRIEADFSAILERPVHDPSGPMQPAALIGTPTPPADDPPLAFTREGEPDAAGLPGIPVRVGYRLREGMLQRLTWPVLDAAPRVVAQASTLLTGVVALDIAYIGSDGVQGPLWPRGNAPGEAGRSLPDAVSLRLTLANGEQIGRLLALTPPGIR